jgi:hypothetical protein
MYRHVVLGAVLLGGEFGTAQALIPVAPPPAVRVKEVGVAPAPGYVWIPGYHRWTGNEYVWIPGRWVLPPRAGATWVAPRYVQVGDAWVFHKGYWR